MQFSFAQHSALTPHFKKESNAFQLSVAFHVEPSHLTCSQNEMTGFYMKCNTELKLG